jgi:hypothetical protein
MGRQRALDALFLRPTDRIPSQEVFEHPGLIGKASGIDPFEDPVAAYMKALPLLDIDWVADIPREATRFPEGQGTIVREDGSRITEYGTGGSLWEDDHVFHDLDDVLAYRPLEDSAGRVRVVRRDYRQTRMEWPRRMQSLAGETVLITGLYYTTLFQFCIMAFGWENFLQAAALEPRKFGIILDQFTEISVENVRSWVSGECPVFFFHDDLAITRGLVFAPAWYRKEIFPRYERILEPALKAGKRTVFVSDGRYDELMPDLVSLGIHGLMFDSSNDLDRVLRTYGDRIAVIGNMDTRIITQGSEEEIKAEVRRCAEVGRRYPGYFFKAFGDLPHNIPLAKLELYNQLKRDLGKRG